jgi:hypothetical protein
MANGIERCGFLEASGSLECSYDLSYLLKEKEVKMFKFNLDDEVYYMFNNKITCSKINHRKYFETKDSCTIKYSTLESDNRSLDSSTYYNESDLYNSKQELLENL